MAECANLFSQILYAAQSSNLTNLLNTSKILPKITPSKTLIEESQKCKESEDSQTLDPECAKKINDLIVFWYSIDPLYDKTLNVNIEKILEKDPNLLLNQMSEDDFDQQAMFELFERYQSQEQIFQELYAMTTAFDPSFSLKETPKIKDDHEIIQELVLSNNSFAIKIVDKINGVNSKLRSHLETFKKWRESKQNPDAGSLSTKVNDIVKSIPESLINVLKSVELTKGVEKKILPDEKLVKYYLEKPVYAKNEDDSHFVAEETDPVRFTEDYNNDHQKIYINRVYANLAKILVYILSPEYIDQEKKFLEEFEAKRKSNKTDNGTSFADYMSKNKDNMKYGKHVFVNLDPIEHNKIRQIALIMLTNLHIILLNKKMLSKDFSGKNELKYVANQIIPFFVKQLKFLTRYIFALKTGDFKAIDLTKSLITEAFADVFIYPLYPKNLIEYLKNGDHPSMILSVGENIYSIYSTYVLGSINGVLGEFDTSQNLIDKRPEAARIQHRLTGIGHEKFKGLLSGELFGKIIKNQFNVLLSLIPIPIPSIISNFVFDTVSSILVDKGVALFDLIVNSCVYSGQNCHVISKSVVFNKTLETRITEFLQAYDYSVKTFVKDVKKVEEIEKSKDDFDSEEKQNENEKYYIPTLEVLAARKKIEERNAGTDFANTFEELTQKLIDRVEETKDILK